MLFSLPAPTGDTAQDGLFRHPQYHTKQSLLRPRFSSHVLLFRFAGFCPFTFWPRRGIMALTGKKGGFCMSILKKHKKALLWAGVAVAVSVLLIFVSRMSVPFASWYAQVVFPFFPNTIGRLFSIFPFSVYEIVLYLLFAALVAFTGYFLYCLIARRARLAALLDYILAAVLVLLPGVLLLFTLTAGVNYSRASFASVAGYEVHPSSADELEELCRELAVLTAAAAKGITLDENGNMTLESYAYASACKAAMKRTGDEYPFLQGYYPNPKPVLFSYGLSHLRITGMYSPFTVEANYNNHGPAYAIPFTVCHELAHLKGFMREDEAGFIAFLACRGSGQAPLVYSGGMNALQYAMGALYATGRNDAYYEIMALLPACAREDFRLHNRYWAQFETKVADISSKVNDTYLKANAQSDGVKSYGRMVDLLLAEKRSRR